MQIIWGTLFCPMQKHINRTVGLMQPAYVDQAPGDT